MAASIESQQQAALEQRLAVAVKGRYRLEHELGRGGMAFVYLAHDLKHDRKVAIKLLQPEVAKAVGAPRFLREIGIAARLNHPHILPLHDSGEADGMLYYVMPYVEGETLRDKLRREKALPLDEMEQVTRDVAGALDYAHSQGVIHRDIKPENILLSRGLAVVADFGIARAVFASGVDNVTETGLVLGTPGYMSPEQGVGDREVDGRADIYALGCVAYEMLLGEPPFSGSNSRAVMARHLSDPVPSIRTIRDTVPKAYEDAVIRALAKTPADRFRTAGEFVRALGKSSPEPDGATFSPVSETVKAIVGLVTGRFRVDNVFFFLTAFTVVIIGIFWLKLSLIEESAGRDVTGLAVFPFISRGAATEEWSEQMSDLLATLLNGTPQVRVADPWSLWRPLQERQQTALRTPDPVEASRMASAAAADLFVLGSISNSAAGEMNVTVRLYSSGEAEPLRTFLVAGHSDSLLDLTNRIAVEIIAQFWEGGEASSLTGLSRVPTSSPDALKALLDARRMMRRGRLDEANEAIDIALRADSAFPLALVEAPVIKSWLHYMNGTPVPELFELAQRSVATSVDLDIRSQLRARAVLALIRTDGVAAAEAAGRIVSLDSTDFEGWMSLAYSHRAYGWQYGMGLDDALDAAEHAAQLDPTHIPSLVLRAELAISSLENDDIERQVGRLEAADTTNMLILGALGGLRCVLASENDFAAASQSLRNTPVEQWRTAFNLVQIARPDRAEAMVEHLAETAGPGMPSRLALIAAARLRLAEGRFGAVDSALQAGEFGHGELRRAIERTIVAANIAGVAAPGRALRSVEYLNIAVPAESALAYFSRLPDVIQTGWAVAAFHASHGDTALAVKWRSAFETLPAGGRQPDYRGSLQADLNARLAARRGRYEEALQHAFSAFHLWGFHTDNMPEDSPEPAMRFHLAELLRITNRPDNAAAILQSMVPPTAWLGPYVANASLLLGEFSEGGNDSRGAARHYRTATALWELGGLEVAGLRERAEEGLRRVSLPDG